MFGECLGRSDQSIIIDRPSKIANAIESDRHLKSAAIVQANFHVSWDDNVVDALKSHC